MKETGCYTKDQFDSDFASAVIKGAKKAHMNPAIINGKAQKIYLQFRVGFVAKGDDRKAMIAKFTCSSITAIQRM
jgi:hypothetical protein